MNSLKVRDVESSTATRVLVDVEYKASEDRLPTQLCIKGGFDCAEYDKRALTFQREALAYREVLPFVSVNRPGCYYAGIDQENGQGVVVLDDIISQGGMINQALQAVTPDGAADFLDALALLHASSWNIPLLYNLPWLSVCMADNDDTFRNFWTVDEIEDYLFNRGRATVVDPSLQNPERLIEMFRSLGPIEDDKPRCILHGDTHIGNTYRTAAGEAAFFDWQGISQGPWIRDVAYFLASNLEIEDRRRHERGLLSHYLHRRKAHGAPVLEDFGKVWTHYRYWVLVPLIVWIRNSNLCQPEEVNILGTKRSSAAVMDLETLKLF